MKGAIQLLNSVQRFNIESASASSQKTHDYMERKTERCVYTYVRAYYGNMMKHGGVIQENIKRHIFCNANHPISAFCDTATSMATADGTARFIQRALSSGRLHPSNARRLGKLTCTALGFGAYRLVPTPTRAVPVGSAASASSASSGSSVLLKALQSVNVVDTSSHYAFGHCERVIGATLHEFPRDEVILCTKVGHVPPGQKPKGAVPIGAIGARGARGGDDWDDWHCIKPAFVDSEVRASAERLGTKPDFVLLHNPEYMLSARMQEKVPVADAWDEMYQSLFDAFKTLERLCALSVWFLQFLSCRCNPTGVLVGLNSAPQASRIQSTHCSAPIIGLFWPRRGNDGIIASGYGVSSNFLSCMFSVTGLPNLPKT